MVSESDLQTARRHVREGEARVLRQEAIVSEMHRDNHPHAAALAELILRTMQESLRLFQLHLAMLE